MLRRQKSSKEISHILFVWERVTVVTVGLESEIRLFLCSAAAADCIFSLFWTEKVPFSSSLTVEASVDDWWQLILQPLVSSSWKLSCTANISQTSEEPRLMPDKVIWSARILLDSTALRKNHHYWSKLIPVTERRLVSAVKGHNLLLLKEKRFSSFVTSTSNFQWLKWRFWKKSYSQHSNSFRVLVATAGGSVAAAHCEKWNTLCNQRCPHGFSPLLWASSPHRRHVLNELNFRK